MQITLTDRQILLLEHCVDLRFLRGTETLKTDDVQKLQSMKMKCRWVLGKRQTLEKHDLVPSIASLKGSDSIE